MHQEREYPKRVHGTGLANPDFVGLAKAYGYHGQRITKTEEFEAALLAAIERQQGTLIEVMRDAEVITTRGTLTAITEAALKKKA
jgi:acetolactate synthase-1/2/3 large subunit